MIFRPGNYTRRFPYGFGVVVRDLGEWRLGLYSEFRYASRKHSDLPWGAILRKVFVFNLILRFPYLFFFFFSGKKLPKLILFQTLQSERNMWTCGYKHTYMRIHIHIHIQIHMHIHIHIHIHSIILIHELVSLAALAPRLAAFRPLRCD